MARVPAGPRLPPPQSYKPGCQSGLREKLLSPMKEPCMVFQRLPRRQFLKHVTAASAALTAVSWSRAFGANERLRLASVGVGGKGWSDVTSVAASPHVEVVAICDVDESLQHLGRAAEKYPRARRFTDWRRLLDQARDFDAVTVSTPDHMHGPITLPAMHLHKHVVCQK